ncbi:MAG: adenosylcobinamide-GDP ribazoletransferase [Spirochaetaceae bacterium]|jgi:adenosylcobinamide-GDP ribazoletransferase|nr:adenosylcobinamide-GDP ribazoletransferase [Spirochaetaceae bacterium]
MMFDRFLSVFCFVSRIPVKIRFKFDVSRMDFYLPLVGIFPAFLGLAVYFLSLRLSDMCLFSAAAAIFVQYLGFNLFHLDGLADTADAFLGSVSREKRFAILKDSRIGVYGLFAGFSALIFKLLLLYGLLRKSNDVFFNFPLSVFSIFIYPVSGRFSAALIPCMSPPAKPEGLGALAAGSNAFRAFAGTVTALLIYSAVCLAAAYVFTGILAFNVFFILIFFAIPLFAGLLSALFYARIYRRALGGYSGDALGASIETGEIICLLFTVIASASQ